MPPRLPATQIRGRTFLTEAPYEFADRVGRLGEGPIIDRYWHVQEGDVVFDVGAGHGLWTLPSCALGARVYAVEPNESSCVALERLLALNRFTSQCHIVQVALSNRKGEHPAELRACAAPFFEGDPEITTLDALVKALKIPKVDWIKIDVEGGERCVIAGGLRTLMRYRPVVVIEDHTGVAPFMYYCVPHDTRGQILATLKTLSYTVVDEPYSDRNFIVGWPSERVRFPPPDDPHAVAGTI